MAQKTFGVIMAGGGGTRFWPLSRKNNPKQLLNLSGKNVMLCETVSRLNKVVCDENIYVVTNAVQAEKTRALTVGQVKKENVLEEPSARNTAACIGYAAVKILKMRGDGIIIVSPSDAYIKDEVEYARLLEVAVKSAERNGGIVTLGVTPTFPATGYGYIQFENSVGETKLVKRFVEKPCEEKAREYLKSGDYVWNCGVFVFKASVIMESFKKFLPDIYEELLKIGEVVGTEKEKSVTEEIYPSMRSVSVDYGIMEKAENIYVVPGEFGWSDVGSWDMLNVLHSSDNEGNLIIGDGIVVESKDVSVYAQHRTVAVVGVENLVVVETPDAVLVCPKDKAQEVKKIVDELKKNGRDNLL